MQLVLVAPLRRGFLRFPMAYDKSIILEQCLEAIRTEKLTFFADIALFVAPALSTLYEWELDQSEDIKNELAKNKLASKRKMRSKWEDSDNATMQLAAYKLYADKTELEALTMNRVEQSGSLTINWNEQKTYETMITKGLSPLDKAAIGGSDNKAD